MGTAKVAIHCPSTANLAIHGVPRTRWHSTGHDRISGGLADSICFNLHEESFVHAMLQLVLKTHLNNGQKSRETSALRTLYTSSNLGVSR